MSGKAAKISLIVPVYNVEPYLARCLDSCARQTLLDLEILCVNDGSTDRSREILEHYAGLDSRIRIIDRENGGVSAARNAGLDAANGEWIMFLDADDYLEPDACERVWAESLEEKTDIIVFGGTFFPEAPVLEENAWLKKTLGVRTVRYRAFQPKILLSEAGAKPFIWIQAYSAAFIGQNRLRFDETVRFAEDILFQFTAFPLAKRFSFLSDPLYHHRVGRKDSLMGGIHIRDKVSRHLEIADRILTIWEGYGIAGTYGLEIGQWAAEYNMDVIPLLDAADRKAYLERMYEVLEKHGLTYALKELLTVHRKNIRRIERESGRAARNGDRVRVGGRK